MGRKLAPCSCYVLQAEIHLGGPVVAAAGLGAVGGPGRLGGPLLFGRFVGPPCWFWCGRPGGGAHGAAF